MRKYFLAAIVLGALAAGACGDCPTAPTAPAKVLNDCVNVRLADGSTLKCPAH